MKKYLIYPPCFLVCQLQIYAQDVIKIGIIGLDTSHSTAFTELLNGDSDDKFVKEFEVVAAYPYGSKTIQSSYERIPGYIEEVKKHGVEITSSIAELLDKVDCVMLETNDGRIHLEQAMEVFKSGKYAISTSLLERHWDSYCHLRNGGEIQCAYLFFFCTQIFSTESKAEKRRVRTNSGS